MARSGYLDLTESLKVIASNRWPQSVLLRSHGESVRSILPLATAILCHHFSCKQDCDCSSCVKINREHHPDLLFLLPTGTAENSSIKIDDVRLVLNRIARTPQCGKKQVVIIDSAHKATVQAANALLKNLEEPKPGLYFILTSDSFDTILPTIRSRCFVVTLPRIEDSVLEDTSDTLWLDFFQSCYPTHHEKVRALVHCEQTRKLCLSLINMWPVFPILHLADILKEHSLGSVIFYMQQMVYAVLSNRYPISRRGSQVAETLASLNDGVLPLSSYSTYALLSVNDYLLSQQRIVSGPTVHTGTYQLDSLLYQCHRLFVGSAFC